MVGCPSVSFVRPLVRISDWYLRTVLSYFNFRVAYSAMSCNLFSKKKLTYLFLCGYFSPIPFYPVPTQPSVFLVWVDPTLTPVSSFPIKSVSPLNLETFARELCDYPNPRRDYVLAGIRDGFHIGFDAARIDLWPSHRNIMFAAEHLRSSISTSQEPPGCWSLYDPFWSVLSHQSVWGSCEALLAGEVAPYFGSLFSFGGEY